MNERLREYWSLLRFEWATHYQFPVIEGIFAAFLGVALFFTTDLPGLHAGIVIGSRSDLNGIEHYQYYINYGLNITTSVTAAIFTVFAYLSVGVISIVMAFNFGRAVEDGFAQTCLSYPVGRRAYLSAKVIILLVTLTASSLITVIGSVNIFIPGPKPYDSMALYFISYWIFILLIASCTTLIAVVMKDAPSPLIGGLGIGTGLLFLSVLFRLPDSLRRIMNPVLLVSEYLSGGPDAPLLQDVLMSWSLLFVLGLALLSISYIVFDRQDIKGD